MKEGSNEIGTAVVLVLLSVSLLSGGTQGTHVGHPIPPPPKPVDPGEAVPGYYPGMHTRGAAPDGYPKSRAQHPGDSCDHQFHTETAVSQTVGSSSVDQSLLLSE